MSPARANRAAPQAGSVVAASAPPQAKTSSVRLGRSDDRAESRASTQAEAVLASPGCGPAGPAPPSTLAGGGEPPFDGGRPLSLGERAYFEPRFGRSFAAVRVHQGGVAGLAVRAVGANAFALGKNIAFEGPYGRAVMAHELAHVTEGESGVLRRDIKADVNRRGIVPDDVRKLNPKDLQDLTTFVENLLAKSHGDDQALLGNYAVIRSVWAERADKAQAAQQKAQAANAAPPQAGAGTPNVTAPNPLIKAMDVFASIRPHGQASGLWKGQIDNRVITLNAAQYGQLRVRVVEEANKALRRAALRTDMAAGRYAEQQKVDDKHWIIAPIVKTLGGVSDPGPALRMYVATARDRLQRADQALAADDFRQMARLAGEGEAAAEQSALMVAAYVDQIIGAAEMTVTVLEGIKTAAEITLFLCAIAATGGLAGAGATALGLEVGATTTVLGVTASTATWATVVTTGAVITEEVALGIEKAGYGEQVDWGTIAAHAAIQVIVAKLGPGAGNQLTKFLGKAAVANVPLRKLIASVGMQRVVTVATTLLLHEATQMFVTAIEDTIAAFRGKPMTWATFGDHIFERLTDPKGLFMATLAGLLGGMHQEPAPGAPKPASTGTPDPKPPRNDRSFADVSKELGLGKAAKPPGNASSLPKSPTDNADFRPINRELGLPKPRTKTTPTPAPPPGYQTPKAEDVFQPSPQERQAAMAKEPPGRKPPPKSAEEAFRPTSDEQRAAFAKSAQDRPDLAPVTDSGEPILESKASSPRGEQFVAGSAQTKRGVKTAVIPDVGESAGYKAALSAGEIGLERPQGVNIGGRDDFVTAARDPSGKMWIIATDAKTRSSPTSQFEKPTPGLRKGWDAKVKAAVDRVDLGKPRLEAEIKAAYREGRVWVRQVNVDMTPQGKGSVSGIAAPRATPWGALNPTPNLTDRDE
jgi:hypothetical protein